MTFTVTKKEFVTWIIGFYSGESSKLFNSSSKAYCLHLLPTLLHNECEMISYLWTRLVLQGRLSRNTSFTLKNAKDPKTGQQQQPKKRLFFSEWWANSHQVNVLSKEFTFDLKHDRGLSTQIIKSLQNYKEYLLNYGSEKLRMEKSLALYYNPPKILNRN